MKLCWKRPEGDVQYKSFELGPSRVHASQEENGKVCRTRVTSVTRSEYHGDLKPDLHTGLTRQLVTTALIVAFGSSFLFGYNMAALNQPKEAALDFYNVTYTARLGHVSHSTLESLWTLTSVMFIIGGVIGACLAGCLSDRLGRKTSLLLSQVFVISGVGFSVSCVGAGVPELLFAGRLLLGIHSGISNVVTPMYLTEIAPYNLRGAFGTLHQLAITLGIFCGSVFGLTHILGSPDVWQYLFLVELVPSVTSLCFVPFLHESARYLFIIKQQREQAERTLMHFYGKQDIQTDLEEIDTENNPDVEEKTACTLVALLQRPEVWRPLLVACALQLVQQFSGINAIIFFSHCIFHEAGVPDDSIPLAVCGTNGVNFIMTMISVAAIDRFGRRLLLILPMVVMVLDLVFITISLNLERHIYWMAYISVICVIVYVISFAIGLGPIPLMIGSELCRQKTRAPAMAIIGSVNWAATFVIAVAFESIQERSGNYTFVIFLVLMIFFTVYVFLKVPETRLKTIEEIVHQYSPGGVLDVEEALDDCDVMVANDSDVFDNVRRSGDSDTQSSSTHSPESLDLLTQTSNVDDVV